MSKQVFARITSDAVAADNDDDDRGNDDGDGADDADDGGNGDDGDDADIVDADAVDDRSFSCTPQVACC